MNNMKKHFKSIVGICSIILGVIAIIFGYNVYYYGSYELEKSYGGDAYTGIQNAAATTANNVDNLGEVYVESYQLFMTFVGVTMITGGVLTISFDILETKTSKKNEREDI